MTTIRVRAYPGQDILDALRMTGGAVHALACVPTRAAFGRLLVEHGLDRAPGSKEAVVDRWDGMVDGVLYVAPDLFGWTGHDLVAWPLGAAPNLPDGADQPFTMHVPVPPTAAMREALGVLDRNALVRASATVTAPVQMAELLARHLDGGLGSDFMSCLTRVTTQGEHADVMAGLEPGALYLSRIEPVGLVRWDGALAAEHDPHDLDQAIRDVAAILARLGGGTDDSVYVRQAITALQAGGVNLTGA